MKLQKTDHFNQWNKILCWIELCNLLYCIIFCFTILYVQIIFIRYLRYEICNICFLCVNCTDVHIPIFVRACTVFILYDQKNDFDRLKFWNEETVRENFNSNFAVQFFQSIYFIIYNRKEIADNFSTSIIQIFDKFGKKTRICIPKFYLSEKSVRRRTAKNI